MMIAPAEKNLGGGHDDHTTSLAWNGGRGRSAGRVRIALPKFSQAEAAGVELTPGVPQGIASYVTMGTLPGKKPLIKLSDRPPNYETPLEYLRTPITPNDAVLRALSPLRHSGGQGRGLQDRGRRRRRQRSAPRSRSTT